jgi:CRP/FNR family transcriptional regulator
MNDLQKIQNKLPFINSLLLQEFATFGTQISFEAGIEIVREGQYIKVIPIVLEGVLKIVSRHEDKEFLLYYIEPAESCIMSFSAILENSTSKVFAMTEEPSTLLLLPSDKVLEWLPKYPQINQLFYQQYTQRYADLLNTANSLIFDKMETRLYLFLKEKSRIKQDKIIEISHREIANSLGTAREVITRVLKKLEHENKIKQLLGGIKVL